ncbi:MAG: TraX family protein [Evtepia gabavorous]
MTESLRPAAARRGLTDTALKGIAVVSMVLDHIYYFFGYTGCIPTWCSMVGRLAAPLFLFCLVEGFVHTSNRKKYFFGSFRRPMDCSCFHGAAGSPAGRLPGTCCPPLSRCRSLPGLEGSPAGGPRWFWARSVVFLCSWPQLRTVHLLFPNGHCVQRMTRRYP